MAILDPADVSSRTRRRSGRSRGYLRLAAAGSVCLALHAFPEVQVADLVDAASAFATPTSASAPGLVVTGRGTSEASTAPLLRRDALDFSFQVPGHPRKRSLLRGRTALEAAAVADVTARVMNALGAGAVAAVIQAALSACLEPVVNRVLVRRMSILDAFREMTPSMMFEFFKTTLFTNLIKFPLFEAVNAFCNTVLIPPTFRGIFTGFAFTTATLPVTNYRYRKSMQLPVQWGNIYEAYLPTVLRDMVYVVVRNRATVLALAMAPAWRATSPEVMFIVVLLGCFVAAPFNELRGYLLQNKGHRLSFGEFFRPANFLRSTTLGALKQGFALAVGYWCAPIVQRYLANLLAPTLTV